MISTITEIADPQSLWQATLNKIELQIPRGTFDSWLRGSTADPNTSNGRLLVRVKNRYAAEWLDGRLRPVVERSLTGAHGAPIAVEFAVLESAQPAAAPAPDAPANAQLLTALTDLLAQITDPAARQIIAEQLAALGAESPTPPLWEPPDVDTSGRWFPVPEYTNHFWAPLLGSVAFRVWMIIRQHDTRPARLKSAATWTPVRRFTAPFLARLVPCGVQAIKGVWRRCEPDAPGMVLRRPRRIFIDDDPDAKLPYRRQPGALEVLVAEGLARREEHGRRRHKTYAVQVHITPAVLAPRQVARLNGELQTAHDAWLLDAGVASEDWRV